MSSIRLGTSANIATRLSEMAAQIPHSLAVAAPRGRNSQGKQTYQRLTFGELEDDTNCIAAGLQNIGIVPGMRIILLVRPGIDFISLTYALFKTGAVIVLIDPGMGRQHMLDCLSAVQPEGFVALPLAHAVRVAYRRRFPVAKYNVTVGRRWFWRGPTLDGLRKNEPDAFRPVKTKPEDHAAIIFTTGSTGPPKGVLYSHGNFSSQVDELRSAFQIEPGEIDLPGFPLFALFNGAMGVTTVIPEMDFTRPADVDPRNIVEPIIEWKITQSFGSPALWNVVGKYCETHELELPTLKRVLSAGAPVPPHVLQRMKNAISPAGDIFTPYGATESLPVASISATEVLGQTRSLSEQGKGTCVGRRFSQIQWKVIRISDEPIGRIEETESLPTGEIGELIVKGPVVTTQYVTCCEHNALSKIQDPDGFWHRMGDVGYLDTEERFWFCGRKNHRVITADRTMYTIPCEAIFNCHPSIYRTALVGIGMPGDQIPVLIAEPWPEHAPQDETAKQKLVDELAEMGQSHSLTQAIQKSHILLHSSLPVDIRHNAKIFREQLRIWAAEQLQMT